MSNWRILLTFSSVSILFLQSSYCDVTLRVLLQPPMVTLECLISNPDKKASAIISCPNNNICFRNCSRQCDKNCSKNNITCSETKLSNGMSYRYTFDTSNLFNQGEWICHYGGQRSSTVLFSNQTILPSKTSKVTTTAAAMSVSKSTAKLLPSSDTAGKISSSKSHSIKGTPIIKPLYVIIILILLALSLFLNIVFVIHCIATCRGSFSKTYIKSNDDDFKYRIPISCLKFFCVPRFVSTRLSRARNRAGKHTEDSIKSTAVSNNIYECSPCLQSTILLDNGPYISPVANHRLLSQSMFARSQSFPAKAPDFRGNIPQEALRWNTNTVARPNLFPKIPSQDSISQRIYDEVPEQRQPFSHFSYLNSPYSNSRSSRVAMSLTNLNSLGSQTPDRVTRSDSSKEGSVLKDAINSRVELSKEMISHADTLLRRAGTLLNDKMQLNNDAQ